jgi:hypothetical protein
MGYWRGQLLGDTFRVGGRGVKGRLWLRSGWYARRNERADRAESGLRLARFTVTGTLLAGDMET